LAGAPAEQVGAEFAADRETAIGQHDGMARPGPGWHRRPADLGQRGGATLRRVDRIFAQQVGAEIDDAERIAREYRLVRMGRILPVGLGAAAFERQEFQRPIETAIGGERLERQCARRVIGDDQQASGRIDREMAGLRPFARLPADRFGPVGSKSPRVNLALLSDARGAVDDRKRRMPGERRQLHGMAELSAGPVTVPLRPAPEAVLRRRAARGDQQRGAGGKGWWGHGLTPPSTGLLRLAAYSEAPGPNPSQ